MQPYMTQPTMQPVKASLAQIASGAVDVVNHCIHNYVSSFLAVDFASTKSILVFVPNGSNVSPDF